MIVAFDRNFIVKILITVMSDEVMNEYSFIYSNTPG